jgi:hypothetical protein
MRATPSRIHAAMACGGVCIERTIHSARRANSRSGFPRDFCSSHRGMLRAYGDVTANLSRAADGVVPIPRSMSDGADAEAKLRDVADTNTAAELVVVLRGTVRRWGGRGSGLWVVRLPDGKRRIVSSDSVVAVTRARAASSIHHHRADTPTSA